MNDVIERIDLFLKNKTYVFIRLNSGSIFNGYIESKDKDSISLKDDMLGVIPILINEIEKIDYSTKNKVDNDG